MTLAPEPDQEGFHQLWPTPLLRRRIPGHESANQELLRVIRAEEARRADLTTDYRGGNLLTSLEGGAWAVEPTVKMLDQISLHKR